MRRIIKKTLLMAALVVLAFSLLANWGLRHDKKALQDKLNDYEVVVKQNKLLMERVESCEQDLTDAATMLDAATRELQALKKD